MIQDIKNRGIRQKTRWLRKWETEEIARCKDTSLTPRFYLYLVGRLVAGDRFNDLNQFKTFAKYIQYSLQLSGSDEGQYAR